MNSNLPIFMQDELQAEILKGILPFIPDNTQVYLFSGTIRNALYYHYFQKQIRQKDFDCVILGDAETFVQNLTAHAGFEFGSKNSPDEKVLKKARIKNPTFSYDDWVYLDLKIYDQTKPIEEALSERADFTISAVALDIKEIENPDWEQCIIALPHAREDIQRKNLVMLVPFRTSLLKIVRMMSQGFSAPSKEDVTLLYEKFKDVPEDKFKKNWEKTLFYVGSTEKVKEILHELDIPEEVMDLKWLKKH